MQLSRRPIPGSRGSDDRIAKGDRHWGRASAHTSAATHTIVVRMQLDSMCRALPGRKGSESPRRPVRISNGVQRVSCPARPHGYRSVLPHGSLRQTIRAPAGRRVHLCRSEAIPREIYWRSRFPPTHFGSSWR